MIQEHAVGQDDQAVGLDVVVLHVSPDDLGRGAAATHDAGAVLDTVVSLVGVVPLVVDHTGTPVQHDDLLGANLLAGVEQVAVERIQQVLTDGAAGVTRHHDAVDALRIG